MNRHNIFNSNRFHIADFGPDPLVIDIDQAVKQNPNFRTALWSGTHLQVTLMSIPVDGEIGLEVHPHLDQFLRIEEGCGQVMMGSNRNRLNYQRNIRDGFAIVIPANIWHNLINTGNTPIKLYSIYAPPQHPHGTVHQTKEIADAVEEHFF